MSRHPTISPQRIPAGERRERRAQVHWHGVRNAADQANATISARRLGVNERAVLAINADHDDAPDLQCGEMMALRALAEIDIEAEWEQSQLDGHFASGDTAADIRMIAEIARQVEAGNVWAWCSVRVHVTIGKVRAYSGWIGCCSYADRGAYERPGGYYDDQVRACLKAIAEHMGIPQSGARVPWDELDEQVKLEALE